MIKFINDHKMEQFVDIKKLSNFIKEEYGKSYDSTNVPQRCTVFRENPIGIFNSMPAINFRHNIFVTKIGAIIPNNNLGVKSVNSTIIVFSTKTGEPIAVIDGELITNMKCAAVSALVTNICSPTKVDCLAIIGCGSQAIAQIKGVTAVRSIKQIRVYSRDYDKVCFFIKKNKRIYENIEFVPCASIHEATKNAEIVSTTTTSSDPIIFDDLLSDKCTHINCMGNHNRNTRELSMSILENSFLTVENKETAILEAGDVHCDAVEIKDLVNMNSDELRKKLTVFSSTGHAFLDLITTFYFLKEINVIG